MSSYRPPTPSQLVQAHASAALPARELSVIAEAFELPLAAVLVDAQLIDRWRSPRTALCAELARRHCWDASVPPHYVRHLSRLLRG